MTNQIIDEFRLTADDVFIFSDMKDAWFTIAEGLYLYDPSLIPESWGFHPSPFLDSVDLDDEDDRTRWIDDQTGMFGLIVADLLAADLPGDVLYAGRVLTRYGHLLRLAGQDDES